jgi:hypothetical protein
MSYTDLVAWCKLNPDAAASKLIVLDTRARTAESRVAAALIEAENFAHDLDQLFTDERKL